MTVSYSIHTKSVVPVLLILAGFVPALRAELTLDQVAQQAPMTDTPQSVDPKSDTPQTDAVKPRWEGFQLQELDEPLTPLVPRNPRTPADVDAVDAAAYLATGQLLENRSELARAYELYTKGYQKNPSSLLLVRKLMTLALALNKQDEGIEYAQKAVELNPTDVRALRMIGRVLAPEDPAAAIRLFERAVKVPALSHESPVYVTLMLDLGLLYRATNRPAEAAECLAVVFDAINNHAKYQLDNEVRKELRANPQVEFEKLGQAFLEAGKSDLALQAFQKAVESKRGSAASHSFNLAQVYLQTKQADKALAELEKYFAAQRQAKGRAAYELLGTILKEMGRADDLIPRLQELAGKDPRNATLLFFLGSQLVNAKRLDEAEQLFKKGLSTTSDPEGYRGLIQVYTQQNKPDELIGVLSRVYQKQKNFDGYDQEFQQIVESPALLDGMIAAGVAATKAEKPALELNTIYVLAKLAGRAQKVDDASLIYRFLIGQRRSAEIKSRLYDELGDLLMEASRFADATKLYLDASQEPELQDEKPNLIYQLSRAQEFDGKTDEALKTVEQAIKDFPNQLPMFRFQEAWVHYHATRYEKAIELFEKLIVDFKPIPMLVKQAKSSLSNIYVLTGNIRRGEEILEEMYATDKHDPGINNDLGYLYADQGKKLDEAESMIRKAVKAEPENSAYLDSLAWVLYKRGKFAEALTEMEKALELSQSRQMASDATLWDHLGDIQEQLNNVEQAVKAWTKALEAAKSDARPDMKLISKIEDKLKNRTTAPGNIKAERSETP